MSEQMSERVADADLVLADAEARGLDERPAGDEGLNVSFPVPFSLGAPMDFER